MEEGGLDKAIIGVGINLQGGSDAIPSELKEKMIYLYPGGNVPFTRAELASRVADEILAIQGKEFIEEYKSRCFILGSEVTVIKNGKERQAIALDVDDSGCLLVRREDGSIAALNSGEISQLDTPENIVRSPANAYVQTFVLDNLQAKVDSLARFIGGK